ncbi:hypothetical protein FJQ98_21120 [Lysinibacillus agricola]|uniref:Uncharacterized protein n=1 Tax=Lysinibacillus agricola TaxID=2590012 RepID=A0ABX7APF5_9BACI|nr:MULTISPECIES: hypothetical protein [Lysinibacillus]KOS64475.1 hypothetical protein AN161_01960 [Lysinibacillus sp. FJAT-14222]QQP11661.1 hypothetical protein FJQ98_21120 [Lysinibacillus agricola]
MKLKQTITQIDVAEYDVQIEISDGSIYAENFTQSNAVYPAFKTLIRVLQPFKDVALHVQTNSQPLADEYNATQQNPNAALLNHLKMVIARQNLDVTIEYVA